MTILTFEDAKEIIISRKAKDRHYNGKKKKYKMTNNDRQNTTQQGQLHKNLELTQVLRMSKQFVLN